MATDVRIGLSIPTWKRPEITRCVMEYYRSLAIDGIEFVLTAVDSEGNDWPGWQTFQVPNTAVSDKYNAGAQILREFGPDWSLMIGSDDFISPQYFELLRDLGPEIEYVEFETLYVVDPGTWRCFHAKFRVGAGRALRASFMDRIGWQPWPGDPRSRNVDGMMYAHTAGLKSKLIIPDTEKRNFAAVDVKTPGVNIWSYDDLWPRVPKWSRRECTVESAFSLFPDRDRLVSQLREIGCARSG